MKYASEETTRLSRLEYDLETLCLIKEDVLVLLKERKPDLYEAAYKEYITIKSFKPGSVHFYDVRENIERAALELKSLLTCYSRLSDK